MYDPLPGTTLVVIKNIMNILLTQMSKYLYPYYNFKLSELNIILCDVCLLSTHNFTLFLI